MLNAVINSITFSVAVFIGVLALFLIARRVLLHFFYTMESKD